ncbi:MAG TPA: efflux RND transporter periplasmic adaptor subunit [Candidatus Angelobacter sp.]|nr:efflux RND transporter periplasmic adaptor subunit [Candidatus Angelobacter sp.]
MKMWNDKAQSPPALRHAFALGMALLLIIPMAGCSSSKSDATEGNHNGNTSDHPELFTIPSNQMSHVQVVTVQPATLDRTLRLTGAVAYDSFHTTPVITQVSGPVSRIVVAPGQQVRVGQPMLYVHSPDYSQVRTNYLKAKAAYALAEKSYVRAQDLYKHGAIAMADLEAAEAAEVQAGGDMTSAHAALKVMGVADPDALVKGPASYEVPVLAPIGGQVVEQLVSVGQLLQPAVSQCFTISDTGTVWVLVNVYQKDLPYVRVGDTVSIQTDSYSDVFPGRISYVAASLDANTRTLPARIETVNPGEKLKKDMYVIATVQAGRIENAISVPDAAVLRDSENQPFVYVEVSAGQFGRRTVTLGESLRGQTQVITGLQPGDRVVGDGSLFLQFANSLQR